MKSRPLPSRDPDLVLVWQAAACVSVLSFLYYLRQGNILLYGDAVAHINNARRVFDSRTPGLLQLGTVWLPLPHLLMLPFLLSDWAWQTGIGGSLPSLLAYVFSVVGVFRLVREALGGKSNSMARRAAWGAAAIFAANPNLVYLQVTAMTEPLYLAFFVWAIVYFADFVAQLQEPAGTLAKAFSAPLIKCGLCLAAACLTRYDGWFLAAVVLGAAVIIAAKKWQVPGIRGALLKFALVAAAAPALWLAYNATVYGHPLEFATGPYSARAIELRTSTPGASPHPGTGDLTVAFSFFLKAGELQLIESNWHRLWLALAIIGSIFAVAPKIDLLPQSSGPKAVTSPSGPRQRALWPLLLLWMPVPFYTLSVAYGSVPIFIPPWWPFTLYNTRYGVQLLPAFSVFVVLSGVLAARRISDARLKLVPAALLSILVIPCYFSVWHKQPISFREAWVNSRTRMALEHKLASTIRHLPHDATFLMYLGAHPGAFEEAGVPLRRVIHEGNHRTWKRPTDPEGLWERALAGPERYVDFVIAVDGDAVAEGVQKQRLTPLAVLHVTGQPSATVYQTQVSAQGRPGTVP